MEVSLVELKAGQTGVISSIKGGQVLREKLDKLGIREGKKVSRVSSALSHGPVTITVDNYQVAVGHGKATRIIVEVATKQ